MNDSIANMRLRVSDALLLLVPAAWASLNIIARNPVGIPHAERLLLVSVLLWALVLGVDWLLIARGMYRKTVVHTTFVILVVLLNGGAVVRQSGALGWALLALVIVLTWLVTSRMSESVLPDALIVAIAIAIASGPILDAVRSWSDYGSSQLLPVESETIEMSNRADIYLVILDGFPGTRSMDTDFGASRGTLLAGELGDEGFNVPASVSASYPATDFSVPSILDMGYPVIDEPDNRASLQALYDIVSGDNVLRETLTDNGYDTYMVESGWSGSSCRSWYDHCVASSWLDDPMYQLVRDSVSNDLILPGTAYQYAVGSQRTMSWLTDNLPDLSVDSKSDFVFAHVTAPHAPLFLEPDCEIDPSPDREGYFFRRSGTPDEVRSEYLDGQIECLTRLMVDLNQRIDPRAVLVFTSDHGTDRRDQTARDPATWTSADQAERMNAFIAARLPSGCTVGDELFLPNLMRRVLSCMADSPLADVADEMYLFNRDWANG